MNVQNEVKESDEHVVSEYSPLYVIRDDIPRYVHRCNCIADRTARYAGVLDITDTWLTAHHRQNSLFERSTLSLNFVDIDPEWNENNTTYYTKVNELLMSLNNTIAVMLERHRLATARRTRTINAMVLSARFTATDMHRVIERTIKAMFDTRYPELRTNSTAQQWYDCLDKPERDDINRIIPEATFSIGGSATTNICWLVGGVYDLPIAMFFRVVLLHAVSFVKEYIGQYRQRFFITTNLVMQTLRSPGPRGSRYRKVELDFVVQDLQTERDDDSYGEDYYPPVPFFNTNSFSSGSEREEEEIAETTFNVVWHEDNSVFMHNPVYFNRITSYVEVGRVMNAGQHMQELSRLLWREADAWFQIEAMKAANDDDKKDD
jgi:hypothetical protein